MVGKARQPEQEEMRSHFIHKQEAERADRKLSQATDPQSDRPHLSFSEDSIFWRFYNLLKELHQPETKCLNTWAYEGLFSSKPRGGTVSRGCRAQLEAVAYQRGHSKLYPPLACVCFLCFLVDCDVNCLGSRIPLPHPELFYHPSSVMMDRNPPKS